MGNEITVESDIARNLLPADQNGGFDFQSISDQVHDAIDRGSRSLAKLKEATSGGLVNQLWQTKGINGCVSDALEAITTLSKTQIVLQAYTAKLNQKALDEQRQINQQQQELELQHKTLAEHSKAIEDLIQKSDVIDIIENIVTEQDDIRKGLTSSTQEFNSALQAVAVKIENQQKRFNKILFGLVILSMLELGLIGYLFSHIAK